MSGVRIGMVIRPDWGTSSAEGLRQGVERLRSSGHEVWPRLTYESGDGSRLAAEVAELGADLVVAVGGDGTVNEVVNGLVAGSWSGRLAVVPRGTGNDFALGLGVPTDVDEALSVALSGRARPLDVARVNDRAYVNVSTGGFGAMATGEATEEAKRILGPVAYLVTGMRRFTDLRPSEARFELSGEVVFEGAVMFYAVANGRRTGASSLLVPDADPSDGALDLVVVPALPRMDFLSLLPGLRAGSYLDDPAVLRWRFRTELVVTAAEELSVNADGERVTGSRFTYRLSARRLTVMVPG